MQKIELIEVEKPIRAMLTIEIVRKKGEQDRYVVKAVQK